MARSGRARATSTVTTESGRKVEFKRRQWWKIKAVPKKSSKQLGDPIGNTRLPGQWEEGGVEAHFAARTVPKGDSLATAEPGSYRLATLSPIKGANSDMWGVIGCQRYQDTVTSGHCKLRGSWGMSTNVRMTQRAIRRICYLHPLRAAA